MMEILHLLVNNHWYLSDLLVDVGLFEKEMVEFTSLYLWKVKSIDTFDKVKTLDAFLNFNLNILQIPTNHVQISYLIN